MGDKRQTISLFSNAELLVSKENYRTNKMTSKSTNTIDLSESIPSKQWGEFFDQFSINNSGRNISIEIINPELGNEELVKDSPLLAMIYDRPGKGDNLAIEVGRKEVTYAHNVEAPTSVSTGQNNQGDTIAISITDPTGTQTLVKLQTS